MPSIDLSLVKTAVEKARAEAGNLMTPETICRCISCLDHTSLSESDSPKSIRLFTEKALAYSQHGVPSVAAICVYPPLVDSVGLVLSEHPLAEQVKIAAVCGGFPSGQTYLEVKILESAMAIENGADEIDTVINLGALLEGDYGLAKSEIESLKEEIGDEALLKVILETGTLSDPELIYRASLIAIEAGADFIKTSTGKTPIGATPEAVALMCMAIREAERTTGKKTGIKISGGVTTPPDAVYYCSLVRQQLGESWLTPELFRIGSSRLLESLITLLATN